MSRKSTKNFKGKTCTMSKHIKKRESVYKYIVKGIIIKKTGGSYYANM